MLRESIRVKWAWLPCLTPAHSHRDHRRGSAAGVPGKEGSRERVTPSPRGTYCPWRAEGDGIERWPRFVPRTPPPAQADHRVSATLFSASAIPTRSEIDRMVCGDAR